jgi:hypothetical protein
MSHRDILACYVALLCLGKSDFEAITGFRADAFFHEALGLERMPSEGILRQRMDAHADANRTALVGAPLAFLRSVGAPVTPLANGLVPLDADTTPFDNSGTRKQGVSLTYKGHDGFAPMAVDLGQEGWCLELEMREGKQHSQNGTPALLERVLLRARTLTDRGLLLRLDGGYDAIENIAVIEAHIEQYRDGAPAHDIIKWNPRQESPAPWIAYAEAEAAWEQPRPGKRVAVFHVLLTRTHDGYEYPLRRVIRVIERTIDKQGQQLLVPEIELEGWWTSLRSPCAEIIALYAEHATSEQVRSELKTDLDIERLPSGKFATDALVLAGAQLAYNLLRWIGQSGLLGPDAPPRRKAKRQRLRTVMQELMYLAARLIRSGRRLKLAFGWGVTHCLSTNACTRAWQGPEPPSRRLGARPSRPWSAHPPSCAPPMAFLRHRASVTGRRRFLLVLLWLGLLPGRSRARSARPVRPVLPETLACRLQNKRSRDSKELGKF